MLAIKIYVHLATTRISRLNRRCCKETIDNSLQPIRIQDTRKICQTARPRKVKRDIARDSWIETILVTFVVIVTSDKNISSSWWN